MSTVTIPKKQYERLKRYSSAYVKIAEEMAKAEGAYPYDEKYVGALAKRALHDHRKGKTIAAESIDEALTKQKQR